MATVMVSAMIKNFIVNHEELTDEMIDWVMSPVPDQDIIIRSSSKDMEDLAVEAGLFPSRGQARKNGFCGTIPWGLSMLGTKKNRFWVWNTAKSDISPSFNQGFDWTEKVFGNEK
jgi:hypothetical protein